jgi:uncharacterized protein with FMN-binding domain
MPRKISTAGASLGALLLAGAWHPALAASRHAKLKATTVTYKGPIVDTNYGPIEAIIKVKSKKIAVAQLAAGPDTERSAFIDEQAAPLLRQEVLKAQSAKIDIISGATFTSEAFIQSLNSAVKKAKKAHTLK